MTENTPAVLIKFFFSTFIICAKDIGNKSTRHVTSTDKKCASFTVQITDRCALFICLTNLHLIVFNSKCVNFHFSLPSFTNASERESRAQVFHYFPSPIRRWLPNLNKQKNNPYAGISEQLQSTCEMRPGWANMLHVKLTALDTSLAPQWGYVAVPHHCACRIYPRVNPFIP